MEEVNQTSLPDGYSLKATMNFKKGKFALFANLTGLFVIIAGIAALFFLFEYDTSASDFLYKLVIKLLKCVLIFAGFLLINPLIQIMFYKAGGGGKAKLHIGLMVEVYSEKPIKRNNYFYAQLFSNLIPLAVLTLVAIFFWSDYIYLSLVLIISNFLAYLPVFIFVLKHANTSLIQFDKGTLNIYQN